MKKLEDLEDGRRRRPPVPQFYGHSLKLPAIETTIMLKRGGHPTPWKHLRVRYSHAPDSTIKDVKEAMLLRRDLPNGINKTSEIVLALQHRLPSQRRFLNDFEMLANINSLEPAADASAGRQRRTPAPDASAGRQRRSHSA